MEKNGMVNYIVKKVIFSISKLNKVFDMVKNILMIIFIKVII